MSSCNKCSEVCKLSSAVG